MGIQDLQIVQVVTGVECYFCLGYKNMGIREDRAMWTCGAQVLRYCKVTLQIY